MADAASHHRDAEPVDWWKVVGYTLAAVVVVCGLVVLAFVIFFFVAMSSYGSNK